MTWLGAVLKAIEMLRSGKVIPGFIENQYIVQATSHSSNTPHQVNLSETGLIKCDSECKAYNNEGICSHAISVAIQCNCLEKYAYALSAHQTKNITQIASLKIKTNSVGRKKPIRLRKRK